MNFSAVGLSGSCQFAKLWPIEIVVLPNFRMVIFHGYVKAFINDYNVNFMIMSYHKG